MEKYIKPTINIIEMEMESYLLDNSNQRLGEGLGEGEEWD